MLCHLLYARVGKFNVRKIMLKKITFSGTETVLDVGTGRGMMAIAAAQRLGTGRAVGIDTWTKEGLEDESLDAAMLNAEIEGVSHKVQFLRQDIRELEGEDQLFEYILSFRFLSRFTSKQELQDVCTAMAAHLKPGGRILIGDKIPCSRYERYFREAGLEITSAKSYFWDAYLPFWVLRAKKR
jgi:cyclopropane fatty-acyl-phospholipid synthase-like methyltransferase